MFNQGPQESFLIINTQPVTCKNCNKTVFYFFPDDRHAWNEKCSCGVWLISTLLNHELFESQIEWLRSQWLP